MESKKCHSFHKNCNFGQFLKLVVWNITFNGIRHIKQPCKCFTAWKNVFICFSESHFFSCKEFNFGEFSQANWLKKFSKRLENTTLMVLFIIINFSGITKYCLLSNDHLFCVFFHFSLTCLTYFWDCWYGLALFTNTFRTLMTNELLNTFNCISSIDFLPYIVESTDHVVILSLTSQNEYNFINKYLHNLNV